VGTPKVTCLKRRIEQITPWVHFDCRNELFKPSSAEKLLGPWTMPGSEDLDPKPTYIVDAIDNISSKVSLLNYCHSHSLPVISSMGSATKSDPTKLVIADISLSTDDPLSKSTRRRLKALGISSGIPVIFSTEKPAPGKAELQPLPDAPDPGDLAPLRDFRVRILPVLGTMPAVFGYASANYVICEVAGYPMDYNPAPTDRHKLYDQILATLQGLEERLTRTEAHQDAKGIRIPVTAADVAFLVEEVYRGKSVISGLGSRLALIRWEKPERGFGADQELSLSGQKAVRLGLDELVLMTREEAARHEKEVLKGEAKVGDLYGEEARRKVEGAMEECRAWEQFR
jgi:tRNA threonylcarbamoyladenosine dehydratase